MLDRLHWCAKQRNRTSVLLVPGRVVVYIKVHLVLIYTLAFSNVLLVLALNFMVHKSSYCKCIPSTGDQCSQLIVARLVPSTPICLCFNLPKLQCKQTVVTDFCIGFVNKIHIIGEGMIKETWIAKIKEIGCWTEELITFCPFFARFRVV